ncbi:MAG: hypothetical protein PHY21_07280 [Candidatus Cloacimonetes bacterium]|nr:hypothetical protein [Candidatus Cloacimonadota bacterium]MDD4034763.1 hypothetical protein [Candidatus Cloacimonadota bacterium]MDD4666883.1 hypothetical protein [Candidatus Cloacimonadota bacterium]
MKVFVKILLLMLSVFMLASCDNDEKETPDASAALAGYWENQSNLTASLVSRDATMHSMEQTILALGSSKDEDPFAEWETLVNTYNQQCGDAANYFIDMRNLEDNIVPYGSDKGLLGDIARGVYNKAADAVISSGRMVRSGFRVLTGKQSLRQVLNDPESGIPIVSSFAAELQQHNAARDAAISQSILNGDSQEGFVPINDLPGATAQDKVNYYLNLPDEDPQKLELRSYVSLWDPDERIRTAATAKKLGETGVKLVGDAYGGGVGEWTNEVLVQHMNDDQDPDDKGSLKIKVNSADSGTPPIEGPKTIIIDRADVPESEPKITVIMDAPQELVQELPSGNYNIIAIADEFIRNVDSAVTVAKEVLTNQVNELLKLAENAIIVEGISANPEVITLGGTAYVNIACMSTLGQNLDFNWSITGGAYTNISANNNQLSFKPSAEGTYNVACEIKDSFGNLKNVQSSVSVINAHLTLQQTELTNEQITDSILNPGELATYRIYVTNDGEADLTGTAGMQGFDGVQLGFNSGYAEIPAGETAQFMVNVQLPANFSEPNANMELQYLVEDSNQNPVLLSVPISIPVDFYAEIDPIESPVTDRVLTISGTVANPMLQNANLIIDGESEQAFEVELTNGRFSQQVAIGGSTAETPHTVELTATSGSLTASTTANFTSQVLPTALRITLSWDTGGTDVDLWVTDPNGERCYYAHRNTASGLSLDFDDTNGYGPENITTSSIIPGDYVVQVHFYSDHDSQNAIGTNAGVVIRINEGSPDETVNNYYGFLGDTGAMWAVTTLTFDGATWRLKEKNTHTQVDPSSLPAK